MTYYRVSKQERFTQIDNRMINDTDITAKAKGILLYILSKPDSWKVYETDIINNMKDGRDAIRSGIKELVDAGYISRKQAHDENGKFNGYEYIVYEYKTDNPDYTVDGLSVDGKTDNGKTDDGKTDIGKPDTSNTNLSNTYLSNTELSKDVDVKSVQEEQAQNVFAFYEQNFTLLSPYIAGKIDMWLQEFEPSEADVIVKRALELTVLNGRPFSYAEGILKSWVQRNAKTMAQIDALQAKRERELNAKNRKHHGNARPAQQPVDGAREDRLAENGIDAETLERRIRAIEAAENRTNQSGN